VHRDLKPANVLLAADGAKLADFGIARPDPSGTTGATRLTETAAIVGTFPYMSPEQRAGAELDRRSDLFSVGVMLYEALTGTLPQGAFTPPSQAVAGIPARVDGVVSKLLRPRPEARYADARDAALELEAALRPRASMAPVAVAGAVTLAVIGVVVFPLLHQGGSGAGKIDGVGATGVAAVSAAPSPTDVIGSEIGSQAQVDNSFGGVKFDAKNLKIGKKGIGLAPSPTPPPPQALENVIANVPSKQESSFVKQMENQAKAPNASQVAISLVCDPTLVYSDPSLEAKLVAKLPAGVAAIRMKEYKRLAELEMFVLGRAAGLSLFASEAPSKKSNAKQAIDFAEAAPQQAQAPNANEPPATATPTSPSKMMEPPIQKANAPLPSKTWWYVRAEKVEGWIEGSCGVESTSPAPTTMKPKSKPKAPSKS
ncbi:MAG TPA: protein kinase, partial [bacterium]|nr:protein kinase [bacterium]